MDTMRIHIKTLVQVSAIAAYFQQNMPNWVTEDTPRVKIKPYLDRMKIEVNRTFYVQEQTWFKDGQDPPVSEPTPKTFDISLREMSMGSDLRTMRFDFGIGYELYAGDKGVVVYWVYPDPQEPVCAICYSTNGLTHIDERTAFCSKHYVPASDEDLDALERAYLGRH